jgi:hypothetical protein
VSDCVITIGCHVTPTAFPKLLRQAKRVGPTIAHVWLDMDYTGQTVTAPAKPGVTVDAMSGPKPKSGFTVQPRRWVVQRTNGSSTTADVSTATK